ncbi:unnamed protein product [Peniophora sp. CBMAI 1063]|nr:unnamed protein product [Peniophora sp. CBMAI 1063]
MVFEGLSFEASAHPGASSELKAFSQAWDGKTRRLKSRKRMGREREKRRRLVAYAGKGSSHGYYNRALKILQRTTVK